MDWKRVGAIFTAGVLANGLARGQALFGSLYSIDGYFVAKKSFSEEVAYDLGDGRFVRALLWRLQELLGFAPLASEAASIALTTAALVVAAILFGEAICGKQTTGAAIIFVVLFTLHPFLTEYFYYAEVAFGIVLSVLFAALAVRLTSTDLGVKTSIVASAATIVAALATYQAALGFVLASFILASAMEACAEPTPLLQQRIRIRTASLVLGASGYALCLLLLRFTHPAVASGRAFSFGGTELGERLAGIGQAVVLALAPPGGIVTTPVAATSAILVACGTIAIGIKVWRRHGRFVAAVTGGLVVSAIALACSPVVLARTPWPAFRLLSPSALVFASLAVACYPKAPSWSRRVWMASAFILALGYIAADASILFDQRRANLWDHQLANRIVAKLEEQPNFPSMRRLFVVGRLAAHPFALPTDDHDMNSSAFNAPWSKVAVVEQATGLIFDRALETDAQTANTYCAGRDPWPASGAVTVTSALGIVCLSKP